MTYNKPEVLVLGNAAEVIQGHPKKAGSLDAIVPGGPKVYQPNPAAELDE